MNYLPSILYKYFPPERQEIFDECLIRYSPLGAFNDPFEGQPDVTALTSEANFIKIFDDVIPEEIQSCYSQLPVFLKSNISYEFWETYCKQHLAERTSEIVEAIQLLTPRIQNSMTNDFNKLLGAFCLSETPDSLLMWAHYSASHTGFVIGFDAEHTYFHQALSDKDEFRHLRRVVYRDTRLSGALSDLSGVEMFLVKSSHWSYEREWRIFRALADSDKRIQSSPYDIDLFRFSPKAIKSVIFGARMLEKDKEAIIMRVKQNKELNHVVFQSAITDRSHFICIS